MSCICAGGNAAENNVLPFIIVAAKVGLAVYTAYELKESAEKAYELYKRIEAGEEFTQQELQSLALELGIEVGASVVLSKLKVLEAAAELAEKSGLTGKARKIQEYVNNIGTERPNTVNGSNQAGAPDAEIGFSNVDHLPDVQLNRVLDEPNTSLLSPRNGTLSGEPEIPHVNANADMIRSLTRQNEAAEILSQRGLDITHLPNTGKKGGNPDLSVNGRPADVYSPKSKYYLG